MAKRRLDEEARKRIDRDQKLAQDLAALEMQWADEFEEDNEEYITALRENVMAPPKPEVSKYNPDGIVDIITFAEHPYFLGQTLHPWQKVVLITFYMGTEGNQNLNLVPSLRNEQDGCKNCVWEYNKKEEAASAILWRDQQVYRKSYLPVENSPCVTCSRFDCALRQARFDSFKEGATRLAEERKYERIEQQEVIDRYESMEDLMGNPEANPEVMKQVKSKMGEKFSELLLVCGRRGSKSLMVTVIALYEVYRLLEMKHPQKRYNLLNFDEIGVLNVAASESQARTGIFSKLKPIALSSPYMSMNLGKDLELSLIFRTENDKKENERRRALGIPEMDGTIVCKCGHSRAQGLVGGTNWLVILDELAAMVGETKDSGVDYRLYEDLKPTIATFGEDGKVFTLSNPKGPVGLLFELFNNRQTDPSTLIYQLPTWIMNPSISKDFLDKEKAQDPEGFAMQYGAQFGDTLTDPFLTQEFIDGMFHQRPTPRVESPQPMVQYFCHIDPANSSDYYALVVLHLVPASNQNKLPIILIDHVHYWEPLGRLKPINSTEVENYVIALNKRFRFSQVSCDQWNTQNALINLNQNGCRAVCKPFNKSYVEMIYGNLYQLIATNSIFMYNINTVYMDPVSRESKSLMEVDLTRQQLQKLQKKWKNNGYKVEAAPGYHDDIPDCIAAAAYEAMNTKIGKPLPSTRLVYMGP